MIFKVLYFLKLWFFWSALFMILVSLAVTKFSEKMLIYIRCMHGFISNL